VLEKQYRDFVDKKVDIGQIQTIGIITHPDIVDNKKLQTMNKAE